jgi:polyisoprenoid-binding protein YceI
MIRLIILRLLLVSLTGTNITSEKQSFEVSKDNASILISGTSNLHDWKMHLKTFDCNADFVIEGSNIEIIDKVTFSCNAEDLKSDNSLMDKKAYSALKSKSFPQVRFDMTSPLKVNPDNNKFSANLKGNLNIAGKSSTISIPVNGIIFNQNGNNIINVNGDLVLKMSDFGISPPAFMMGALKTGDSVTVSFTMQFSQNS